MTTTLFPTMTVEPPVSPNIYTLMYRCGMIGGPYYDFNIAYKAAVEKAKETYCDIYIYQNGDYYDIVNFETVIPPTEFPTLLPTDNIYNFDVEYRVYDPLEGPSYYLLKTNDMYEAEDYINGTFNINNNYQKLCIIDTEGNIFEFINKNYVETPSISNNITIEKISIWKRIILFFKKLFK